MTVKTISRLYPGPSLLFMVVALISVGQAFWSEFDLVSVENSNSGIVTTQLKIVRFNKTTYAISGAIDLTEDLNDDYDCEMKAYLSSQGNSNYKLLPYKVPRDACCTHLESLHWKGIENRLRDCSNIPKRIKNEKFCFTLKKDIYEMENFSFNYYLIPKILETGTYKIEIIMYEKGSSDVSSMSTYVARIY